MKAEAISIEGVVVVAVETVRGPQEGSEIIHVTRNIVTYAGDLFYAERAIMKPRPTNFTDSLGKFNGVVELYNGKSQLPAKANTREMLSGLVGSMPMCKGYPVLSDDNPRNKGRGKDVVSYMAFFKEGDGNGEHISDVVITNPKPSPAEPLLLHCRFAKPWPKDDDMIVRVFLNHKMSGL